MAKLLPRLLVALIPSLSLAVAGCGDPAPPIDPETMAEQAALHAREIVHQTGGGVSFTTSDASGLQKLLEGMAHSGDGVTGSMAAAIPPAMGAMMDAMTDTMGKTGAMSPMGDTPMAGAAAGMDSLLTTEEKFDDTADDMRSWLRTRILTADNLETKTDDEAVYLLHGTPTCLPLLRDADPLAPPPVLDQDCVEKLAKLQVRVVMRADGDGTRLMVEVGPDRLELVALVIHSNLLATDVDLAKAHAATDFINATLQTGGSTTGTRFEALEGAFRLALRKDGERRVTLAVSVTKAVRVAEEFPLTAGPVEGTPDVRVAVSDPLVSFTADGLMQTATVAFDVGAVDVRAHWEAWDMLSAAPNRDLHVAIGGLTGEVTFKEGVDQLVAKGLGIGQSSLQIRNTTVFDLGLNPTDMHRFDLKVVLGANGKPRFEIAPRFDLAVGLHFAGVASDFSADNQPPSWALDETYGIRLDNAGAAAAVTSVPATATFGGGLAVGPGTLKVSSNKVADPVTVPAGKCLTGLSMVPAGAHPLLGGLTVVDCP